MLREREAETKQKLAASRRRGRVLSGEMTLLRTLPYLHRWLLVCLLALPAGAAESPARRPRAGLAGLRGALVLNEDNSHFFSSRPAEAMTLAGVQALVDGYAGSQVTHLFFSPNSMRASFRSRSREAIWDPVAGVAPTAAWPTNARKLHEAGLDPYAVWLARSREHGISPWLSMRMNDVHNVDDPNSYLHSEFWRSHPEYRRNASGPALPWINRALNYRHDAVRGHQMAFVRELLERYDPDGLELDWMRFAHHLTPGREREEAHVLDAFMREVRALVRAKSAALGRPVLLGVRVPAHPDAAAGLGMDAVRWAREGLVDLVVPCPYHSTSDFDIPVELWRERLGGDLQRVVVAPGLEHNARAWPAGKNAANDLASARGFAASAWQRGADSIYLFNWMDSETRPVDPAEYAQLLREGLSREASTSGRRRHPVTYRDTVPTGFPNGVQLPLEGPTGGSLRLFLPNVPASSDLVLIVGLAQREGLEASRFEARLNDRDLTLLPDLADRRGLALTARALRWACPAEAARSGPNTVTLRQVGGPAQQAVWVELRVEPRPGR